MTATLLYRIAAVILVVFAAGHTAGFLSFRPESAEGLAVYNAMNSVHFAFNGVTRCFADFYVGFGLQVSVYLLFSALLSWQLGSLAARRPGDIRVLAWAFALVQLAGLALCLRYFFIVPTVFSAVLLICLVWAATLLRDARTE